MTAHSIITAALALLVLLLLYLLLSRIRAERRQTAAVRRMNLAEFADFLRSNSLEGTIQLVAGKVSDLLKGALGCERIVFLRKQRGFLELNYYHGIRQFNRQDFRLRFSRRLVEQLGEDFRPRPLADLDKELPEHFMQNLRRREFNLFFPIFWRDNLYGLYFIQSTIETSTESFNLLVAAVAQSLSAAYHIKWHEQKLDRIQRRLDLAASADREQQNQNSSGILRLVRHRNSETVVRKIFDTVRTELDLKKAALLYEPKEKNDPLHLIHSDNPSGMEPPDRETFDVLIRELSRQEQVDLDQFDGRSAAASAVSVFKKAGLKYAALFPLSASRVGLFVWAGERAPSEIASRLRQYRDPASVLISNAEMFEKAEEMSYTDGLTGLANRRYFLRRLKEEIDRAKRYTRSLALIILDMDELKAINDQHGHQAGDAVIRRMGGILRSSIRAIDIIARYGGDEFCVVMPEADSATCARFMNRLQQKIAMSKFCADIVDTDLACTISLGGAVFPDHAADSNSLIFAADMALLKAKEAGRNHYRLYEPVPQVDNPSK
ncbi:MAG TPA: GGDEF domain-containing protein [Acidobacteriota bacterium]|nr:GGDEF domain-containing protein [Acidobacteriota bacterium]